MRLSIPEGTQALTADWLTQALRANGVIKNSAVTSVEIARATDEYGRNKGIVGVSCRAAVTYDRPEANAPQTLYVKLSQPDNSSKRTWFYQNEVRFYQNLASRSGLRTPRCYYADIIPETGQHILLLEEIQESNARDLVSGYSIAEADKAVRSIAKFHANWWEKSELDTLDWIDESQLHRSEKEWQDQWQPFVKMMGNQIPESIRAFGTDYGKNIVKGYQIHHQSPRTLLHGDYRVENILFPEDGVVVPIDWQVLMRGRGVTDVAYNLVSSLHPDDRRNHEEALLRVYHNILTENGVRGYSFEQCFDDYRLSMIRRLQISVSAIGSGSFASEQGARVVNALLPRLDAALTDLRVYDLLKS